MIAKSQLCLHLLGLLGNSRSGESVDVLGNSPAASSSTVSIHRRLPTPLSARRSRDSLRPARQRLTGLTVGPAALWSRERQDGARPCRACAGGMHQGCRPASHACPRHPASYRTRASTEPWLPRGCKYGTWHRRETPVTPPSPPPRRTHSLTKKWAPFPILLNKILQSCKSC